MDEQCAGLWAMQGVVRAAVGSALVARGLAAPRGHGYRRRAVPRAPDGSASWSRGGVLFVFFR